MYLSTLTRSSGLLLGAGAAFVWRPWRAKTPVSNGAGVMLNVAGFARSAVLVFAFINVHLTDRSLFRWQLAVVSILSLVVVATVVHPAATAARRSSASPALVGLGKRSYGVYLWSWPIIGAVRRVRRIVVALHRGDVDHDRRGGVLVHLHRDADPQGRTRRWFAQTRAITSGSTRTIVARRSPAWCWSRRSALFYARVQRFDRAAGGADVAIDLAKVQSAVGRRASRRSVDRRRSADDAAVVAGTPTVSPTDVRCASVAASSQPAGPARLVIVGDSQAHALAINLPSGIESAFTITDGSVEGCSVYDDGTVRSQRAGFNRSFADCGGWADKWGKAASKGHAQIALVVLGAWDVFDVEVGGQLIPFNTPAADKRFTDDLGNGVAALRAAGLEGGAARGAVHAPEGRQGRRCAGAARARRRCPGRPPQHSCCARSRPRDPANVSFVNGPTEWCNDPAISTDLGYRWDGVHVYKPGAKSDLRDDRPGPAGHSPIDLDS